MVMVPAGNERSAMAAAFAPLRYPAFRTLWIASVLAGTGSWAQAVGAAWLMVELTHRADLVAFVQSAASAPVLFLSFLAGTLADLYQRRLMQMRAQLWVIFGASLLMVLCLVEVVTPLLVLALTFIAAMGSALRAPAWQASIRDIVPDRDLAAAVTLSSIGFNFARILGPAIGGLIVTVTDPTGAFAFNIAVSILLLLALHKASYEQPDSLQEPGTGIRHALRTGAHYVWSNHQMRLILPRATAAGIPASAVLALLPVLVSQRFSGQADLYGYLLCSFGMGAVASPFALAHWRRSYSPETLFSGASSLLAASLMCLGVSTTIALSAIALMIGGFAWVIIFTTLNTSVQFCAEMSYRGRALSAYMTCAFGGLMIGSLVWGSLAEHVSLRLAFSSAGAILAGSLLLRCASKLPDGRDA